MADKPKEFSFELGDKICQRLATGETLKGICEDEYMPVYWRALIWIRAEGGASESFARAYARSRLSYADSLVDDMQMIADTSAVECEIEAEATETAVYEKTGNSKQARIAYHKQRRESEASRRQRIDVRKWISSRVNRAKYGERIGISDETPTDQVRKSVDLTSCSVERLEAIAKLAEDMPDVEPEQ